MKYNTLDHYPNKVSVYTTITTDNGPLVNPTFTYELRIVNFDCLLGNAGEGSSVLELSAKTSLRLGDVVTNVRDLNGNLIFNAEAQAGYFVISIVPKLTWLGIAEGYLHQLSTNSGLDT